MNQAPTAVNQARVRRERTRRERFITELEQALTQEQARLTELRNRCEHPDRKPASAYFDVVDICPDCGALL